MFKIQIRFRKHIILIGVIGASLVGSACASLDEFHAPPDCTVGTVVGATHGDVDGLGIGEMAVVDKTKETRAGLGCVNYRRP